jgi:hypothetical protein
MKMVHYCCTRIIATVTATTISNIFNQLHTMHKNLKLVNAKNL